MLFFKKRGERMGSSGGKEEPGMNLQQLAETAHLPPEQVQDFIKLFSDHNQKMKPINYHMFKRTLALLCEKYPHNDLFREDLAKYLFHLFDTNHDEKVSLQELVLGVSFFTSGSFQEKATLLFKSIDINGDGVLQRKEIETSLNILLNSIKSILEEVLWFTIDNMPDADRAQETYGDIPALGMKILIDTLKESFRKDLLTKLFEVDADSDGNISLEEWLHEADNNSVIKGLLEPSLLREFFMAAQKKRLATAAAAKKTPEPVHHHHH